jgi:hypothetical protein
MTLGELVLDQVGQGEVLEEDVEELVARELKTKSSSPSPSWLAWPAPARRRRHRVGA